MSLLDRLWRAEELLAREPDLDLLAEFPDAGTLTADELLELAALQLSRGAWSSGRILAVFVRYQAGGLSADRLPEVVRLAYQNRVAERSAGAWSDVAALGVPAETLRLSLDGECGWLGQVVLGRFELEARLGCGALTVVYRARDVMTGEAVALKLPARASLAPHLGAVFRHEAEATCRAEHPRVPRVLGCYEAGPVPALVLQLIDGSTLAQWQASRPVDWKVAGEIVRQILEPLAAAHAGGVIHRDPSPANILIDSRQQVWVTDWNASLREDESTARDGDYSGTPGYASQEGLYGLTSRIDSRSDLWGVGAVYYELLTGRRMAAVAGREEAIVHSVGFDPETLAFPDSVPEGPRRVCRKALAPNAALRYGSADEFSRDLVAGRVSERSVRWTDVFEMGHRLGRVRRCWLMFTQCLRQADQAPPDRRVRFAQPGVAQMVLADQTMLEVSELAAAVGLTVACGPIPDWLPDAIYRPQTLTPDWFVRANRFSADSDATQTRVRRVVEAQFASDEMRAVFRLGFMLASLPVDWLPTELTRSPLLSAIPGGVRQILVEMLADLTQTVPDPADLPTLFARRVREWIDAHELHLGR